MANSQQKLPDHEVILEDYARRLERFREGRLAVHLHLSRLQPYNRRDHHLRVCSSSFEDLIRRYEGALFRMHNEDLIVVLKGCKVAIVDEVILRLRYLFNDDPLVTNDGEEGEGFCSWYKLEQDYPDFLALAEAFVQDRKHRVEIEQAPEKEEAAPRRKPTQPLDLQGLASILKSIQQADLSSMLRRQAICAVVPNSDPARIFDEVHISISDLQQRIFPDTDIKSNRWLYQELKQHLDQRMVALLSKADDSSLKHAFSVNLNVSTLLTPTFLKLDNGLDPKARRTVVIELQLVDIFSDLSNYFFARDFLIERGYRVCVDNATTLSLPLIDREGLGVDLVKLQCGDELATVMSAGVRGNDLREVIKSIGSDRLILCHSDSKESIELGQSLGVVLFQGTYVDKLIGEVDRRRGETLSLRQTKMAAGSAG